MKNKQGKQIRTRFQYSKMPSYLQNKLLKSLSKLKYTKAPESWYCYLPPKASYYDALVLIHSSQPPANLLANKGSGFLPWHRLYLIVLEDALHSVGYPKWLGFPYWKWDDPKDIILISKLGFGEIKPTNLINWVENGVFGKNSKDWPIRIMESQDWLNFKDDNDTSYIRRTWATHKSSNNHRVQNNYNDVNTLISNCYEFTCYPFNSLVPDNAPVFSNACEEWTSHNKIANYHINCGGTMANLLTSVNDPLFFLYHSELDRLWNNWQTSWNKKSQKDYNVPFELIGEVKILDKGQTIEISRDVANNLAKELYYLLTKSKLDEVIQEPNTNSQNITMEKFIEKDYWKYIVNNYGGVLLNLSSQEIQTELQRFLNPKSWVNYQKNNYQWVNAESIKYLESGSYLITLSNNWIWMQNMWVVQEKSVNLIKKTQVPDSSSDTNSQSSWDRVSDVSNNSKKSGINENDKKKQTKKENHKLEKIHSFANYSVITLGVKNTNLASNEFEILDLITGESVQFPENDNPLSRPMIHEGDKITIVPKKTYYSCINKNFKSEITKNNYSSMSMLETTSIGVADTVSIDCLIKYINWDKGIITLENNNQTNFKQDTYVLLYSGYYYTQEDTIKSDLFLGARVGHNLDDYLGQFNLIDINSTPNNMLNNNKLVYFKNGLAKKIKIIYK